MHNVMKMDHGKADPAKVIFDKVGMAKGKLPPGFEIMGNRILLGVYERPEKTAGGIILTERQRGEEQNMGKACLVLAKGPTAFVSDANYDFHDQNVEVGDWVSVWVYEARPMMVHGHPCRVVRDTDIIAKIPSPDAIY